LILFILPNFSGGGAERVFVNLINGLYLEKINVEIIVFNDDGPLISNIPENVTIHNLQRNSLRKSILPLINKINLLNPKVIFSTFGYINIVLLLLRSFLPKKIKIWIREANLPSISLPNNQYSFLMNIGYRLTYRTADKVLYTSQRMMNEFLNDFNLPILKLQFLPNPVNDKLIRSTIDNTSCYKSNIVNFIAMGRLTYQKGFDRLLFWFSRLENKRSVLRILGSGPLEAELVDLKKKLNLDGRVIFDGYCKKPWDKIAVADVFLLPSRWEGMPNAALEALVCGTPVIATADSGGISELNKYTKENSVIVTSTEDGFIQEMEKIKPRNIQYPASSLLFSMYSIENVVKTLICYYREN